MAIPVIFSKILTTAKNIGGKTLLVAKAHTPEILIGTGIAGFVGTVGCTVHATNETHDILDEREQSIQNCTHNLAYHVGRNEENEYSRRDYEEDLKKIQKRTRRRLFRAWWPVGTLGLGSVISVLSGYRIINGRYVATAAAYKTLEAGYDHYRNNVVAKFGEEVDKEMQMLKSDEIEENRRKRDEAEKAAENKPRRRRRTPWENCGQIMIFDDHSERWQRYWTPEEVLNYLKIVQNQMNDMLHLRGNLFINELNDRLGLPRTKEGQVVGWYYHKEYNPDSFVDLGIDNMPADKLREILATTRNDEIRVPLYPNPDGIVFDLIGKNDGELET